MQQLLWLRGGHIAVLRFGRGCPGAAQWLKVGPAPEAGSSAVLLPSAIQARFAGGVL